MSAVRHLRIFKNGRSRAVRIPKELDIFGEGLVMRREGERIILEPEPRRDLSSVLEYLRGLPLLGPSDEFPDIEDFPPDSVNDFDE
ncbi:MAG: AbrB/MazE/SpoVT family DNA-binding domain-containing protein [Sphingomonas sp.]|uniref:antitoxin n=1 Tax=Sphingomonas sp. TaxID=28214 RepID=UPI0017A15708|nr:AbrB/MazE/SpoVT family DNA-binding domain-containing protein [Sphingomonas sp.]MBA3668201.1 AbrB/MazE/SpoVT family DNA-binding domain-containing protein [Sphingomonas sp.]